MAERAIELDWSKAGLDPKLQLSREHQTFLENFVEVTKPFQTAFEKLQRQDIPAICQVLPLIYGLRIMLRGILESDQFLSLHGYVDELLEQLKTRFNCLEDDDLYLVACFLDPTIKFKFCRGAENPRAVENRTRSAIMGMMRRADLTTVHADQDKVESQMKRPKLLSFMDDPINVQSGFHSNKPKASAVSIETEFQLYLDSNWDKENPLDFYRQKENQDLFKRLSIIAKQVLCAPATTAGIERIFSISGQILRDRRLSTSDKNFEMRLFCNINSNLLQSLFGRRTLILDTE